MANFDVAKAIFSQVDTNSDGGYERRSFFCKYKMNIFIFISSIDPNEFRQWVASSGAAGGLNSSSYELSSGALDASANLALNADASLAGASGYQASYSSQSGIESSESLAVGGLANAYGSSSSSEIVQTGGATLESSSIQQNIQYASTNGIFNDPNPQVIKRAAIGGAVTYEQKILVKFLQPPPVPPPGVNAFFLVCIDNSIHSNFSHLLSKKFAHLNHLHHNLLSFAKKHHLFQHHLHLFYVNVLQYHRQQLLAKQVDKMQTIVLILIVYSSYSSFGCFTCSTANGYYRTSSTSSTKTT